jgi:hypothetical protein
VTADAYTCSRCLSTTRHPDDIANQYCPACHVYADQIPYLDPDTPIPPRHGRNPDATVTTEDPDLDALMVDVARACRHIAAVWKFQGVAGWAWRGNVDATRRAIATLDPGELAAAAVTANTIASLIDEEETRRKGKPDAPDADDRTEGRNR